MCCIAYHSACMPCVAALTGSPRLFTLPAALTFAAHPCTPSLAQLMNDALPEEAPVQPLSELKLRTLGQRLFSTVGTMGAAEEPVNGRSGGAS